MKKLTDFEIAPLKLEKTHFRKARVTECPSAQGSKNLLESRACLKKIAA